MPSGWEIKSIGGLDAYVTSGSRGWAAYYSGSGDRFIRITNLRRDNINLDCSDMKFVSLPSGSQEGLRTRLQTGDILVSITADLGIVGYIRSEPKVPSYINQHIALVRIDSKDIHKEFIAHQLSSPQVQKRIQKLNDSGSKAGLSLDSIRNVEMEIPPLNEQEKIAKILSTWDEAIEKLKEIVRLKSAHYTYMRDLLTNPLVPKWSGVLNDLAKGYNGLSGKNKNDFIGGDKRFITYNSVFRKPRVDFEMCELVSVSDGEKQNKVVLGDIIFTGSSETPDEVGMSSVILDTHDAVYLNSFCFGFRLNNFEVLIPEFALHYFRSKKIRSQIVKLGQGATRYNLSRERMTQLKISIPSKNEQKMISNVLDGLLQEVGTIEKILAAYSRQKQGLMQQLLTGKKRVKV